MDRVSRPLNQKQALEIRKQLIEGGCPLEAEEQESLPVYIHQGGGPGESMLFLIRDVHPACYASLTLFTDVSPGIHIEGIELQFPFAEFCCDDTPFGGGPQYRFVDGLEFDREMVINGKCPGVLYKRSPWSGFLLGVAYKRLPESLKGQIQGRVTVSDSLGRTATAEIEFMVAPMNFRAKARKLARRESVFTPRDSENVGLKTEEEEVPEHDATKA